MAAQQESFPGGLDLMAAQREWEDRERVLCKCFTSGGGFKWQSYIIGWVLIQMTNPKDQEPRLHASPACIRKLFCVVVPVLSNEDGNDHKMGLTSINRLGRPKQ
jgi:hypothetical protein